MGRGKFVRSLKQRWWLLTLIVVPITVGTLLYTIFAPPKYEGFMTLADRRNRDMNLTDLFLSQQLGGAVNEQEIRVVNLANTITSYSVLRAAYDQLVAERVVPGGSAEAERKFFRSIDVKPLRGSEFIQVSFVSSDPQKAKRVIEVVRERFLARYRSLNAELAENQVQFIKDQLAEQQRIYDQKLQQQKEFMERYPEAVAYETQTSGLVTQMNLAKQRIAEAQKTLAAAVESKRVAQAYEGDPRLDINKGIQRITNPVYDDLRRRIASSESAIQSALERYGPKHPNIIALEQQRDADLAQLRELEANNQVYIEHYMQSERSGGEELRRQDEYTADKAEAAARAELNQATSELANLQQKLDRLPAVQKELAAMQAELAAQALSVNNLAQKVSEAQVRSQENLSRGVYFLDPPNWQPVDPGIVLKTSIAFFLSLIVAVSLIASLGQLDQAAYTASDAENALGFPVIAALPRSSQQRLNPDLEQPTPLAASYQILSTQLMAVKERLQGPGILVASAEPKTGRSTVAANLAISLARDGARVLLIDADLRKPSLHEHFGLQNRAGLAEILSGAAAVEDVVQPTGVEGLLFIGAGEPPVNPVRLLGSNAMSEFVEQISKGADFIVFDSPAGSAFGDPIVLAENVQNVVLIHEAGRSPSEAEYEFHKSLERLGVNVVGMVLNKTRPADCPAFQNYRRNYEASISRTYATSRRAALGPGQQSEAKKPQQYGVTKDDDEE